MFVTTGSRSGRKRTSRWITPIFNAADFTGRNALTWTVIASGIVLDQFYTSGRQVTYIFDISGTTGGVADNEIYRVIPANIVPNPRSGIFVGHSTTTTPGLNRNSGLAYVYFVGNGLKIAFQTEDVTNFGLGATRVQGQLIWAI